MSDQHEEPGTEPVTDVEPEAPESVDAPAEERGAAADVPESAEAPADESIADERETDSADDAEPEDVTDVVDERSSDADADTGGDRDDDDAEASDADGGSGDTPADGSGAESSEGDESLQEPELFDPEETANAPRAPHPLKPVVEALIFASPEPLTLKAMTRLLEEHPKEEIEAALGELRAWYEKADGLQLVEVAGGYQIVTRPELYEWVRRLFKERTSSKLSVQALETLAVIAYKQPVTAAEIAEIRGVSATSGVLSTLLDRSLVKIVGRKQVVGRPFMYGTTREFLDKFGLKDLSDLPKVEDMSEALGFDLPTPVDEIGPEVALPFDAEPVDDSQPADDGQPELPVPGEDVAEPPVEETGVSADVPDEPDAGDA